jgi:hypothetical protein
MGRHLRIDGTFLEEVLNKNIENMRMNSTIKSILFTKCLLLSVVAFAQSDSLKICFVGYSNGDQYKIYSETVVKLHIREKGKFKYLFQIPIDSAWRVGYPIHNISVSRKGKLAFRYRETGLQIPYDNTKRYLVIRRNPELKNKYAVDFIWTDKIPGWEPVVWIK